MTDQPLAQMLHMQIIKWRELQRENNKRMISSMIAQQKPGLTTKLCNLHSSAGSSLSNPAWVFSYILKTYCMDMFGSNVLVGIAVAVYGNAVSVNGSVG